MVKDEFKWSTALYVLTEVQFYHNIWNILVPVVVKPRFTQCTYPMAHGRALLQGAIL